MEKTSEVIELQNKTSDLVVKNARQLLTCRDDAKDLIGLMEGGWVAVTDGNHEPKQRIAPHVHSPEGRLP